jgi:putative hydrolases of HD superfamily
VEETELNAIMAFMRDAERLKNVTRTAWTSDGNRESVAEHSWRLSLLALTLEDELPGIDVGRLLRICIIHDLGEAIGGDISAVLQTVPKAADERADLVRLLAPLPQRIQDRILALWDEYEAAASPEARIAKALDKIETIIQHNQGSNPPDFDYRFNLGYGQRYTDAAPLTVALRRIVDQDTDRRAAERGQ